MGGLASGARHALSERLLGSQNRPAGIAVRSREMAARLAAILVTLLAALVLTPASSLADGDPASDVLLGENVFYPYTPPVSTATQNALNAQTAAARQAGFPLKVALIASPVDLGVIPEVFGKPQAYANFLDQEISFYGRQPLLVVMAAGYGVQGMSATTAAAVRSLPKPAGRASEDLAKAAITAVGKLASAAGHPIKSSSSGSASSSGGSSSRTILLIALVLAALATAGVLMVLRHRETRSRRSQRRGGLRLSPSDGDRRVAREAPRRRRPPHR